MKKQPEWEKKIEEIVENLYVLKGYSVVKWAGGKELKEVTIIKSFIRSLLKQQKGEIIEKIEKMEAAKRGKWVIYYKWVDRDDVIDIIKKY